MYVALSISLRTPSVYTFATLSILRSLRFRGFLFGHHAARRAEDVEIEMSGDIGQCLLRLDRVAGFVQRGSERRNAHHARHYAHDSAAAHALHGEVHKEQQEQEWNRIIKEYQQKGIGILVFLMCLHIIFQERSTNL